MYFYSLHSGNWPILDPAPRIHFTSVATLPGRMAAISLLAASGAWAQGLVSRTGMAAGARAVLAGLAVSTGKAGSVPLATMGADNMEGVNACRGPSYPTQVGQSGSAQNWWGRQGRAADAGMTMLPYSGDTHL